MRFEPQPPSRDDDRELDREPDLGPLEDDATWPVGHLALGEQLRDDANFLADRYPAGAPPALLMALAQVLEEEPVEAKGSDTGAALPASPEVAAPARSIGWSSAIPAVLAGIALAAVAVIVVPQWLPRDEGSLAKPNQTETPRGMVAAPSPKVEIVSPAPEVAEPANPMTPAMFEELSGPEREGLLDLLEHEPNAKPRLSL